jgi:hypothetical protein
MNGSEQVMELLDRFALLRSMQQHADRKGRFSATDKELQTWASDFLHANAPLNAEDRRLLLTLAAQEKKSIPASSLSQLKWFIDDGAGLFDLKKYFVVMAMPQREREAFLKEALDSLPEAVVIEIAEKVEKFEAQQAA